jgi:hypothetical protein
MSLPFDEFGSLLFEHVLELDVEGIEIVRELLPLQKCSFRLEEGIGSKGNVERLFPPALIGEIDSFLEHV